MVKPTARREAATWAKSEHAISVRRGCRLFGVQSSSYYYRRRGRDDAALLEAIRRVAMERRRWGCPRITDRLRRLGFRDNHKRIERIYQQAALQVRRRLRKRTAKGECEPLVKPTGVNQVWRWTS